jgi:hypothetical protein
MLLPCKIRFFHFSLFTAAVLCVLSSGALLFPGEAAAQDAAGGGIGWSMLLGTAEGLTGLDREGVRRTLWEGGAVRKIIRRGTGWAILADTGIFVSEDLFTWEERNQGLPVWTIKVYDNDNGAGQKSFEPVIQQIKDLEVYPADGETMVCAVKNAVYLTQNGGRSWESLGMPPYNTNGIKAVAVALLPDASGAEALTVFCSHSIYGIH